MTWYVGHLRQPDRPTDGHKMRSSPCPLQGGWRLPLKPASRARSPFGDVNGKPTKGEICAGSYTFRFLQLLASVSPWQSINALSSMRALFLGALVQKPNREETCACSYTCGFLQLQACLRLWQNNSTLSSMPALILGDVLQKPNREEICVCGYTCGFLQLQACLRLLQSNSTLSSL